MKKISIIALSLLLCFSMLMSGAIFNPKVVASGEDTDIDVESGYTPTPTPNPEETEELNVSLENGEDAGYITVNGDLYTAKAYLGNKFLGWYKNDQLISANTTYNFSNVTGNVVAKFQNNNILPSPGFENYSAEDNIYSTDPDSNAIFVCTEANSSWVFASVSSDQKYSGNNAVETNGSWREQLYINLKGLEQNTYYKVSFKYKAKAAGATYRGIIAAPASVASVTDARKNALGQRILVNSDTTSLDETVWYTENMEFFTDGYTDVKVFLALGSGRLYIDELTIFKADALDSNIKYNVTATAQNGKAYVSKTSGISLDEEVILTAVGNANTTFTGWYEGENLVSTELNYVIKINENKTLKAVFTENNVENAYAEYDLNGDGFVTEEDATLIADHILQKSTLTKDADFNNDGKISVSDIVILRNNFYSGASTATIREEIFAGTNFAFNAEAMLFEGDKALFANVFKNTVEPKLTVISPNATYGSLIENYLSEVFDSTVSYNFFTAPTLSSSNLDLEEIGVIKDEIVIVDLALYDTADDNKAYESILRTLKDNNNAVIVLSQASETVTNKEAQIPVAVFYNIPVIDIDRAVKSTSAITFDEYANNKDQLIINAIVKYLSDINDNKDSISISTVKMPMQFYYGNSGYVLNEYTTATNNLVDIKDAVLLNGRTYWNEDTLGVDWIGSGFTVSGNFSGEFKVKLSVTGSSANIYAIVDNDYYNPNNIILDSSSGTFTIANLTPGVHTVQLYKATEPRLGKMTVESITYNGILYRAPAEKPLKIQVYGDSITSGSGILTPEQEPNKFISQDGYKTYGNKTAMAFNADVSIMSRSGASVMSLPSNLIQDFCYNTKYGVGGQWDYANNQADIVIIGLGTNDLQAIQNDPDGLKEANKQMMAKLRELNPNAHIIWVYGMMQTGKPEIFSGAVAEMNDAKMHYVFLPRNQDGGNGHPTDAGQRNAASTLVEYIRENIL